MLKACLTANFSEKRIAGSDWQTRQFNRSVVCALATNLRAPFPREKAFAELHLSLGFPERDFLGSSVSEHGMVQVEVLLTSLCSFCLRALDLHLPNAALNSIARSE